MVKEDGWMFHFVPAAGFVNHGFYSFSPCLPPDPQRVLHHSPESEHPLPGNASGNARDALLNLLRRPAGRRQLCRSLSRTAMQRDHQLMYPSVQPVSQPPLRSSWIGDTARFFEGTEGDVNRTLR